MSTKTTFKRVAAIAAAALAIGGLSAVAANAASAGDVSISVAPSTSTNNFAATHEAATETITAIAGTNNFIGLVITSSTANPVAVAVTGGTAVTSDTTASGSGTASLLLTANGTTAVNVPTPTAGTIVLKTYKLTGGVQSSTASTTLTITVGAAPALSAQYSTAFLGTSAGASANVTVTGSAVASSTPKGYITVTANSAASTTIDGQPITATISGAGTLSIGSGAQSAPQGTSLTKSATDNVSTHAWDIAIYSDGRAGTATITVTSGAITLATKTVTFYAAPAKAVATQGLFVGSKSGARLGAAASTADAASTAVADSYAYIVDVTDANGNASAGATVKAVSSNTAVIQSSSCAESASTPGEFNCDVTTAASSISGQTATVTFEVYNAATAAYDILANALTFAVGGSAYSTSIALDSDSYSALAPVAIVASVKDSSGNAAYDTDRAFFTSTGLVSTVQLGGNTLPAATSTTMINGKHTFKGFYAPASAVAFTVSGTDSTAYANAVTASSTSAGTSADASAQAAIDAAQEATDAANAAYDAANNAMDSADAATAAAQDASDNAAAALAAVTSLSATVAKLVSSVSAIATALASIKKKLGVK